MLKDYFYNYVGAWSPDSKKYAFYLNGYNDNDNTKSYRTNVKIGVIDMNQDNITMYDNPQGSVLYTLGSISWIDNKNVLAYTDDNNTWALKVK